jgi:hypothetical protein
MVVCARRMDVPGRGEVPTEKNYEGPEIINHMPKKSLFTEAKLIGRKCK